MGSIVKGILGKSSGKKEAATIAGATDRAVAIVEPFVQTGVQASGAVAGALGLEGGAGQDAAFQNFLNSTGFRSEVRQGVNAITGNQAARGLLQSGATLKRITTFAQDKAQAGFSNFLSNLQTVATRGANAGVGQATNITQGFTNAAGARRAGDDAFAAGIAGGVDQGIQTAAFFSDRRLKTNIRKVGEDHGMGVYIWEWGDAAKGVVRSDAPKVGFMADEVEALYPQHVGHCGGYLTINYPALYKELWGSG